MEWGALSASGADVVVVAPCGYHLQRSAELARQLADTGRLPRGAEVWAVDADSHFVRPGPRVVEGAEVMARILHPDRMGVPGPDEARRVDA
jgi:iron complex transport system substrate-binding protein